MQGGFKLPERGELDGVSTSGGTSVPIAAIGVIAYDGSGNIAGPSGLPGYYTDQSIGGTVRPGQLCERNLYHRLAGTGDGQSSRRHQPAGLVPGGVGTGVRYGYRCHRDVGHAASADRSHQRFLWRGELPGFLLRRHDYADAGRRLPMKLTRHSLRRREGSSCRLTRPTGRERVEPLTTRGKLHRWLCHSILPVWDLLMGDLRFARRTPLSTARAHQFTYDPNNPPVYIFYVLGAGSAGVTRGQVRTGRVELRTGAA